MKGIMFTEPLFHKAVSGEKTQTRRIIKPQPDDDGLWDDDRYPRSLDSDLTGWNGTVDETGESKELKPRYKLGEKLYLKEPYAIAPLDKESREWYPELSDAIYKYGYNYKQIKWQNKLFMPARFARYFIEITGVRAERLQDISDSDCFKEGIMSERHWRDSMEWFTHSNGLHDGYNTPREAYAALIDSINGRGTWESNPFVWVYDFQLSLPQLLTKTNT